MVKFFHRDDLDADTVVPQVTDNQLLLEDHFQELVEKGLGYEDQSVREMRSKAARNELMRALLYSSQVVVNRIGYRNNPFLIDLFREGATDSKAFQDLMRSNAIVPFFYRESSLVDDLDFSTFEDGDRACKYLADSLQGDYGYCRLAKDDATNRSQTAEMGRIFSNYFLGLRTLEVGQCNEMYADLSGSQEKTPEGFEEFIKQLDRLHDFAYANTGRGQSLRRESIYEKFFIQPGHSAATGRFRKPGINGDPKCLFSLKKLVDLRYNSTIPDLLGRYTFVPQGMPSRLALRDFQVLRQQITKDNLLEFTQHVGSYRRELEQLVANRIYESMIVPIPSEMTLSEIAEIRKWDEWIEFANSRRKLVKLGLDLANLGKFDMQQDFEQFVNSFYKFHNKLGKWWVQHHPDTLAKKTAKKVLGAISYGLKIGPIVISLFAPKVGIALKAGTELLEKVVPKTVSTKIKGVSVNILTDFFDDRSSTLDSKLSMSVELLNDNLEADREWLRSVFGGTENDGALSAAPSSSRADQSRSEEA